MPDNKINFARLAYSSSWNLGDHIQTLATEQFLYANNNLDRKIISIERDKLSQYNGEKALLLMQGYFFKYDYQCSFPPSENIVPVFIGFHIENTRKTRKLYSSKQYIDYIKKYEPIGCRDYSTMNFLKKRGIKVYLSRCLTLTFPRRDVKIKGEKIFFIDPPAWLNPSLGNEKFKKLYKKAIFLTQVVDENISTLSDEIKSRMAVSRIDLLRNEAKLVITSRLHIAGPCIAMGIPVVLIPRQSTPVRYEAIRDFVPIYFLPSKQFRYFGIFAPLLRFVVRIIYIRFIIDWDPQPTNIEKIKSYMMSNTQARIKEVLDKYEHNNG
jgi:hypothetical protein